MKLRFSFGFSYRRHNKLFLLHWTLSDELVEITKYSQFTSLFRLWHLCQSIQCDRIVLSQFNTFKWQIWQNENVYRIWMCSLCDRLHLGPKVSSNSLALRRCCQSLHKISPKKIRFFVAIHFLFKKRKKVRFSFEIFFFCSFPSIHDKRHVEFTYK